MSKKGITEDNVKYVASLSRIHLKQDEVEHLTKDLEAVLRYVDKLEDLDVSKVNPTSHVLPLKNVYRKDERRPSLPQEEALKISVQQYEGFFKVPKVI